MESDNSECYNNCGYVTNPNIQQTILENKIKFYVALQKALLMQWKPLFWI